MFRRRDSIVDSITNCGMWRHRIATGIYKRAGSLLWVFVIPPPFSSFPGEILHRFFRKEGRKERRRKKIHRERKQVVTITRVTAHGSNPPREHNRENRDRTLEEFPVRDSIPLKISREIGILFAGIFLHLVDLALLFPSSTRIFFFLSFFFLSTLKSFLLLREEKENFPLLVEDCCCCCLDISLEAIDVEKEKKARIFETKSDLEKKKKTTTN